jgi:hypothetical protein
MFFPQITLPVSTLSNLTTTMMDIFKTDIDISIETIGTIVLAGNENLITQTEIDEAMKNKLSLIALATKADIKLNEYAKSFRDTTGKFDFVLKHNDDSDEVTIDDEDAVINIELEIYQPVSFNLSLHDSVPKSLIELSQVIAAFMSKTLPCLSAEDLIDCSQETEEWEHLQQVSKELSLPINVKLYKTIFEANHALLSDDDEIADFIQNMHWYTDNTSVNDTPKLFGKTPLLFSNLITQLSEEDKKHPVYPLLCELNKMVLHCNSLMNDYANKNVFGFREESLMLSDGFYLFAGFPNEQSYLEERWHHLNQTGCGISEVFNVNAPMGLSAIFRLFSALGDISSFCTEKLSRYANPIHLAGV